MFDNTDGLIELLESQKILFTNIGEKRMHKETVSRSREPYQRDYSRIMYSSSFRRLQGKMQLMTINENKFNRNRLTHSLEVSQIARSISELLQNRIDELGLNLMVYSKSSIYVVEAGALAHDIGNAPFGHHGEKILRDLMNDFGGYEGNAQSLRILMNVEKKLPKVSGLNLSLRTLLSIVKYNVPYNGSAEKYLYAEEFNELVRIRQKYEVTNTFRTIDAQIIDAADEIAYCAHDLEDALAQNYFSIDEFLFDLKNNVSTNAHPYEEEVELFEEWVEEAKRIANKSNVYNSSEEYSFIFRKELTSNIVNGLINDLDVLSVDEDLKPDFKYKTGSNNVYEIAFKHWRLVRAIKFWTFEGINRSSDIQMYEKMGTKVINGLFEALSDEKFNKKMLLMPVEYRIDNENKTQKMRRIADYIGGMMDPSAVEMYSKIYGNNEIKKYYDKSLYRYR